LQILSAISGLLWVYIISLILIDLLNMIGVIAHLDTTFLGLTIMAIGNAIPDAILAISLAKEGYARMGIMGTYAGFLFGFLIGLGFSMLKKTLISGP